MRAPLILAALLCLAPAAHAEFIDLAPPGLDYDAFFLDTLSYTAIVRAEKDFELRSIGVKAIVDPISGSTSTGGIAQVHQLSPSGWVRLGSLQTDAIAFAAAEAGSFVFRDMVFNKPVQFKAGQVYEVGMFTNGTDLVPVYKFQNASPIQGGGPDAPFGVAGVLTVLDGAYGRMFDRSDPYLAHIRLGVAPGTLPPPVPEPGALASAAFGAVAILLWLRRPQGSSKRPQSEHP